MADLTEQLRLDLMAFADGELDPARLALVTEILRTEANAQELVANHRRLSAAAKRSAEKISTASPMLRARIEQAAPAKSQIKPSHWRGVAMRAAAAIVLLIGGAIIGREVWPTTVIRRPAAVAVVPASIVSHAERIHASCSRLADALHAAGYPQDAGALSDAVKRDLRSDQPAPDFSSLGYRYVGAGKCGDPLPDAIHLLYKLNQPTPPAALSVFVQKYHGQYPLAAGRVYDMSDAHSPFAMYAWRSDDVVYFLVADDAKTARNALKLVRAASATTQP